MKHPDCYPLGRRVSARGAGRRRWRGLVAWMAAAVVAGGAALQAAPARAEAPPRAELKPCRLKGVPNEALCGSVQRPLDPAKPEGVRIDVHFAVLPAMARNPRKDPVLFFAGGPGQSAIDLAGPLSSQLARFTTRRDVVLIDQRGTGRSAPLRCPEDEEHAPPVPVQQMLDQRAQVQRLASCRVALQQLPHGDLRHYTTPVAMADADAVRAALGAEQVNILGGSYGTRAVLDYMRQFPQRVRRAVIDGVAPPDMRLMEAFSTDNQAALDALFAWCAADASCRQRHPQLRTQWQQLLAGLPREVNMPDPLTGREQRATLDRAGLLGLVRGPLYAPITSAALPQAISEAAQGRFAPLLGVASTLGLGIKGLASGMHFSVVCSEDLGAPARSPADAPGADFGTAFVDLYAQVCADWPRTPLPPAFYTLPPAPAATLVVSGGIDPVTPPRHGERVAQALGAKARHVVVPHLGHGVIGQGCMRDAVIRFVDAETDEQALQLSQLDCAKNVPRPPLAMPLQAREAAR